MGSLVAYPGMVTTLDNHLGPLGRSSTRARKDLADENESPRSLIFNIDMNVSSVDARGYVLQKLHTGSRDRNSSINFIERSALERNDASCHSPLDAKG